MLLAIFSSLAPVMSGKKSITLESFQTEFKDSFDKQKGTWTKEEVYKILDQRNYDEDLIERRALIDQLAAMDWLKLPGILFI